MCASVKIFNRLKLSTSTNPFRLSSKNSSILDSPRHHCRPVQTFDRQNDVANRMSRAALASLTPPKRPRTLCRNPARTISWTSFAAYCGGIERSPRSAAPSSSHRGTCPSGSGCEARDGFGSITAFTQVTENRRSAGLARVIPDVVAHAAGSFLRSSDATLG